MKKEIAIIENLDKISLESDHRFYEFNGRILEPANGTIDENSLQNEKKRLLSVNNPENYFSGKSYYNSDTGLVYYIYPTVKVKKIDELNPKIIYLDSNIITVFNKPSKLVLQFISIEDVVELSVTGRTEGVVKGNANIQVGKITNGRVTDLHIFNSGAGYIDLTPPTINISKYRILK